MLELIAILVALKLRSDCLKGKCIVVQCDNEAVVQVITLGKLGAKFCKMVCGSFVTYQQ